MELLRRQVNNGGSSTCTVVVATSKILSIILLVLLLCSHSLNALQPRQHYKQSQRRYVTSFATTYNYFAIGSNMLSTTMTALRQIKPINKTAAVLKDYKLCFDIGSTNGLASLIEPSAASVRPSSGSVTHGVLYTLSLDDFARLGQTEGVPLTYVWEACNVIPYVGNGQNAGLLALKSNDIKIVDAFVLRASPLILRNNNSNNNNITRVETFIPPSPSYLRILQRGAMENKLDRDYQIKLGQIRTAKNLLIPDGLSGALLRAAEIRQSLNNKKW